jgi:hypothetical protein
MFTLKSTNGRRFLRYQCSQQKVKVLFLSLYFSLKRDVNSRKIKRKREIRVFISSTFLDMAEEREELIKKTFPQVFNLKRILTYFFKLKKLCADRNVQFSYVDLRWGITSEVKLLQAMLLNFPGIFWRENDRDVSRRN